jgi:hypothetical protein
MSFLGAEDKKPRGPGASVIIGASRPLRVPFPVFGPAAVFIPSPYSYVWGRFGDGEMTVPPDPSIPASAGAGGGGGAAVYATQAAAAVAAYQSAQDPRVQAQVLQARIQNYQAMKVKYPFMATFYNNQIGIMQAKLQAIQQNLAIKVEGEQATREWRGLGQTGVAVGILAGVGVAVLITVLAARAARG